jgi:Putative bacterial sensory transduction regulator
MPWWPLWGGQRARSRTQATGTVLGTDDDIDRAAGPAGGLSPIGRDAPLRLEVPAQRPADAAVRPITMARIGQALDRLEIRFLTDGDGSLLAMWERHALLFALEGPDDEILVMRGRPHATVPPDWADHSYRVVNEWNHTRRFCKAYIGDPTERGQLPIYAEVQVPLLAGVHDQLLDELVDCAAAVTSAFVEWLFDEGALL